MKRKLIPLLALLLLASCYPSSPTYVQQYDLVVTNHDATYDFSSKHTYALSDSIIIVTGDKVDNPNAPLQFVDPAFSVLITNQIKNNMNNRGWTQVSKLQSPDVILLPAAMQTTYLYYYYDWWYYWGWYYPGYPGYGWGWYYPGYYPPTVSGYTTGTMLVSMTDAQRRTPDDEVPVVWTMVINGLVTNDASAPNRVTSSIDQAFTQSPYLNH